MWDSLFGEPKLEIELMVGKITHVDTQQGVYLIQPLDAPNLRNGDTAVSGGASEVSKAFVKNSEIYSINDYVLYARVASTGVQGATVMHSAVILGRAPVFITSYSDVTEPRAGQTEHEFTDYYDLLAKLFDRKNPTAKPDAEFAVRNWLEERMGGDRVLEGRDVLLRVSDELIQILGKRCGIHVNSVDSSVVIHGITLNASAIGYNERSAIVNDSVVHITRTAGDVSSAYDSKNDVEDFSREALESDLVYGKITTLYSSDKTPLAQSADLYDGSHRVASTTGLLFEKTDSIVAYSPILPTSIQYDEQIADKPSKDRSAFDRVQQSNSWKKMHKREPDKGYLRKPGDRETADGVKLTDTTGTQLPGFKGTASWGFLPNGGFIIRDAWGSEIRMCDGDIQISAARNIQYIISQDSVEIVGGVKSSSANQGVELNSGRGNLDINSAQDVNIRGTGNVSMSAGVGFRAVAAKGVAVKSETDTVVINGNNIHAVAAQEATLTGNRAYVAGQADVALASSAAVVRCDRSLTLAGAKISALGDLYVSDSAFPNSTIGNIKVACGKGSGMIQSTGMLIVDKSITCNSSLSVKGWGYFGSLATADAKEVEGGLGLSTKLRQSPKAATIASTDTGSGISPTSIGAALAMVGSFTKDSILATMFTIKAKIVNLIKPLFVSKHSNTVKIEKAAGVDIEGKTRYIYPGETFWKSSGVVTQVGVTTVGSLLDERLSSKPTQGASDIQLSS